MAPNNDGISRCDVSTSDQVSEMVVNSDSSFEMTSNPPGSQESFSIFGDSACGEPLSPQHLMLDFTPVEEKDNDYAQRKCCAFWEFLNSRTDLHNLMVMPESDIYDLAHSSSQQSVVLEDVATASERAPLLIQEKTAVSMLEFVEEKGLIDWTFQHDMCSLGSREYHENEASRVPKPIHHTQEVCKCKGVCKSCRNRHSSGPLPEAPPEVQLMCAKMAEWDRQHPKSMAPPGHPPALSHCVMQRKIVT